MAKNEQQEDSKKKMVSSTMLKASLRYTRAEVTIRILEIIWQGSVIRECWQGTK